MTPAVRSPSGKSRRSAGLRSPLRARKCASRSWVATIAQLLERLDAALGKAMAEDAVIDEVLPEIKRRRAP